MSRRNTHTATNNQECHVFGCTGHVDKLFCVGENCFHKVCKLHYDKSARCQSCNPPAPSAVIAEATSYTNTYVHPVEELSKLKKSKLLKDWSDEAMLHLCQQVQLSRAHFKTEETMVSKWGRVCNSCFSKFPSLVACKWQALQSHYQQTAKALKDLSLTIQRTSRNAEEMKLNDWQMLMLSLISEAERAGYSRNASHEKVAREKESMMPMEEEVLSKQDDNALDDCNDDVAAEEDGISSISFSPPSSKRHKTSIRSTSPLPNSVEAIRAETYRLIAEVKFMFLSF